MEKSCITRSLAAHLLQHVRAAEEGVVHAARDGRQEARGRHRQVILRRVAMMSTCWQPLNVSALNREGGMHSPRRACNVSCSLLTADACKTDVCMHCHIA